ncbi:non-ribosomal peptide synthetase [Nostoc sp. UIC 10630]|uniref:non-ribosomal peptide synthetase n=1 Tax=Nostoc sp. UIC 10630 TaxID=2100146 RepID=UPI0013D706A4|nr:non-ribosomal peptide synthetase [Nostoc sp. UIC 10630]NEU79520.1 amino acid adenylation domain-containing protein [Nostoc sp. UIC 10630]QID92164.1 nonribosomal peptide synthetase [Nostoc sp. UIC 10630]
MDNNLFSVPTRGEATLVDLLRKRALQQQSQVGYTFLIDGETQEVNLTYEVLDQKARSLAAKLQSMKASGERALLLYPPGLEFIVAFFGCLYAGVTAVPVYPPRHNQHMVRLQAIVKDAQASFVLTTTSVLTNIEHSLKQEPELTALHYIDTENLTNNFALSWQPLKINSDTLAFLQYTSGSTGTPKGVMVSHGNLLSNSTDLDKGWDHTSESAIVTWLPTFHDMGLIYGVIQPLYKGIPCYMMAPTSFLVRPMRWLEAISRYKATHSGAPNFAYQLCVDKVTREQLATLDLSSWRMALNGAEPVRADVLKRFAELFSSCGFNLRTFCPGYGLAEATLKVTATRAKDLPTFYTVESEALRQNRVVEAQEQEPESLTLVGCGYSEIDTKIVIVHPESLTTCPPGEVGEIWVSGTTVAQGYWMRDQATEQTFQAYLVDTGVGPFLRTGDLGFLLNGELFVTGRIKDVIIIRGQNHYPQDIELTVQKSHSALRPNCGAAFSVEVEGVERLVIAQEVERSYLRQIDVDEVVRAIRQAVSEQHQLQVYAIVLLKTASIPKTSSGKIQRLACRDGFLNGNLDVVGDWTVSLQQVDLLQLQQEVEAQCDSVHSSDKLQADGESFKPAFTEEAITTWLVSRLALSLGVSPDEIDIQEPFTAYGLDSLMAIELRNRLQAELEVDIPIPKLLDGLSVVHLTKLLSEQLQTGSGLTVPPIVPVSRNTDIPLSWAQERLWFLHQLEGESGAYTIPFTVRLVGNLNIKALEGALGEIVRRHEVLRTRFEVKHDKPVQVIAPNLTITLPMVDLQNIPDPWKQLEQQAINQAYKPFDLANDPVLRVMLWRVSQDEYVLLLAIHHIAADGWSIGVLIRELSAHYRAIVMGSSVVLPELSVQYADFTIWQRQWLTNQVLERQLSYWKQELAGAPPLLELPTDRPRPAIQTFRGGTERFQLDNKLTSVLRQISQELGSTLFMTLLAGFVVLMSRYSGQTDLVVGSPIANRNRKEIERLIGFFVNTLALRFDLSKKLTFKALLEQVRQVTQNAYDHQDLPFEMLVEELHLERNLDRNPLVQVMFALQNAPTNPWDLPGLRVEEIPLELDAVRFDLEVHFWEVPQGLEGVCYYSSDLFDAATIARMMQHFQNLLTAIATNLEQPVNQLPLLTAQEKQQLLVEWNNTYTAYPSNQCIHHLFVAQVERTPNAVAVVFEKEQLTYQELNAQANQLAHYLQNLGVKPGVLVGICVERSLEMVVGLLGILKAGGAYVPLDPEYPTERLHFMLEDAQVKVLLTQQQLVDKLPPNQANQVFLDTDAQVISQSSQENVLTATKASDLAYVIYTSGSTGQPKGVLIAHDALLNLVFWHQRAFEITSSDKATQLASIAFDAAVWELWPYLTVGASIYLLKPGIIASPVDLQDWLKSKNVTISFLPTPVAEQLLSLEWTENTALRTVLTGGDKLHRYPSNLLPFQVVNNYGPTENTVVATSGIVVCDGRDHKISPPIGRPIANTQIYILDEYLQPVPIGVSGELHIAGDSLARGYLNRAELTQQKFIPNPFSDEPHSRLYKTGDLARYLPNGNIEYLGRIDNQVKIRGYRIELGEIEAVLDQHSFVQESVVVVKEDTLGDKCLVAYLVPALHRQTLPQQVAQLQSEYVSDWQMLYEQAYGQAQASTDDLTFNIAGWNSSYTKQPIPDWEMQEWVENTVSRIQANFPQRVLEIGCGTGLLLSRLAKHCQQYWGTDYSIAAIQYVEQICNKVEGLEHVQLLHQLADNFTGIPKGEFDTVILNSIVQYFPSIEYLLQVLEGAMTALAQQGTIFVGDVRSLPLLEPYHAAVQLSQAESDRTIEQWQRMVHSSMAAEEELVIDSSFFIALQTRFPQIDWVEIQPKRGYAQNELTQFRYDVTLHVGTNVQANTVTWLNWQLDGLSFTQIQNQLQKEQPEMLGIKRVPNQRVQQALQIWQWLENPPDVETVSQLRQVLAQQPIVGVNPEQFCQLGQQLGYTVHLSWWESSQDGCYDVVFYHHNLRQTSDTQRAMPGLGYAAYAFWDSSAVTTKPWTDYTNNPLYGKLVQKLVPQVREYIQQKLPDYMVPQAFVVLNALPLTPNGKVDRRALPTPDRATRNLSTGFVLPRTPIEAQIAQIWSEVLGVERIGVKDNFFELGGHSLLATQVLSEINSVFELDLSVQIMFEFPTVAGIADYIKVMDWATQNLPVKEVSVEIVEL